jgi:hypothetical protein
MVDYILTFVALRWVLMALPPRTSSADMRFKPTREPLRGFIFSFIGFQTFRLLLIELLFELAAGDIIDTSAKA